ncbi:mitotic spindle assembly checkpoint protein MAD2B-like [Paramacrobiotus metropolitanus]|uniref:mitotic spindle assembly checkpoint protein MAD2B-like n=1 Tax=Paramacrobiotus metropolitanus TaxID=2943436 RepID=UPI002445D537|nr:mitotic spindle assembly checkpoint protein MAD2B-like [Paramacrobiotus metropolitanus]XP_055333171.1 mitotic spindle assembly checkpoint protein MAD2B-like [Paramacrobiotus metropolitanus]XP_055333172.1 mitotic spindle assembly checkpoint protein MAD2B-like [Paramacrobiotus metropolitanus]XP_055333173.1 mitotic spindle assembly checkpoint protein MAD2B-like [Paramacrobiotus metropolitanus]XP_055333174.1 mitotic spindle assembly checkpoint protein MAD2B-like [Paramacrobiotus metropolitanus]
MANKHGSAYPAHGRKEPVPFEVDVDVAVPELLCEFFEIAIHAILYHRELYPSGIFERKKKYEVPVWIASHPAVQEYVANCVSGIKPFINNGSVRRLMIAIFSPHSRVPLERFVFHLAPDDKKFSANLMADKPSDSRKFYFEFGEALKAFMLKIAACKSYLKPLPPGCTCALQIVTDVQTQLEISEQESAACFPWIVVDDRERSMKEGGNLHLLRGPVEGVCPVEMYVEEAKNKLNAVVKSKISEETI